MPQLETAVKSWEQLQELGRLKKAVKKLAKSWGSSDLKAWDFT
jgi:hypothetical protein